MKKIILLLFICITSVSFAQITDQDQKSHELKFNAFNTIAFKAVEGSYEYILDDESSVGISLLFNLEDESRADHSGDHSYNEKYAITPYYRRFFSKKRAWGFFIEAFGMINQQEEKVFNTANGNGNFTLQQSNNFAMGAAVGGKFVTNKGFAFEFYGGVGRNLTVSNDTVGTELVPRLGVSFGYRF